MEKKDPRIKINIKLKMIVFYLSKFTVKKIVKTFGIIKK